MSLSQPIGAILLPAHVRFPAVIVSAALAGALWSFATPDGAPASPTNTARARALPNLVPEVTRPEIEAHVRFLAADERKGRVTGTPEADECARYLAEVLQAQGLEPAGDDGTFLQKVPMVRTSYTAPPAMTAVDSKGKRTELVHGRDFSVSSGSGPARTLRVVVAREAKDLPAKSDANVALFVDAGTQDRRAWLAQAGLGKGEGFGLLLAPGSKEAGRPRTNVPTRGAIQRGRASAADTSSARVNGEWLDALRKGDVASLEFTPNAVREEVSGANVVARLAGVGTRADPELAKTAVVITAHYDHIDHEHVGATSKGPDQIWNGADDDASGTAAVLEIAGAMAKGPAPARTVVFVLVTGEEVGLLGTDEYLDRPVVPLERTVANVNFEMIGRPDLKVGGGGKLWLTGYELTNLGPAWAAAKLDVFPDPYPNEHFFERSDNIAFVNRGIVGQTLSTYNLHKDYHKPSDEADTLDYDHVTACAKTGLAAVQSIASGRIVPAWTAGQAPRTR